MSDRDERIREIAYFLWLEEGSPEGAADRHWLAAEAQFESEAIEDGLIEVTPDEPKKTSPR